MATEEVLLKLTISDKPDWGKILHNLESCFLKPVSRLVEEHQAGSLSWHVPNDGCAELIVDFNRYTDKDRYFAAIKKDTSVRGSIVCGAGRGHFNLSLKGFLIHLTDFFGKALAERAVEYAEVAALGVVMEEMKDRLTSIQATASFK